VEKVIRTVIQSWRWGLGILASALLSHGKLRRSILSAAPWFGLSLCLSATSLAQQVHPTESQVKAAYLFNFGKFVQWPIDHGPGGDSFELCVLGQDPFGPVLDATVAGESISTRKIAVVRISKVSEAAPCNVLYVSGSEGSRLAQIIEAARHSGTLTVSDIPHFVERGGIIGFVKQQDRIRFEVNRSAAEDSHLTLSSELLKLALKVVNKDTKQE
jgi:YfiR/HmsC-like